MRRTFVALLLSLFFALPAAAHADSFQYTIIWDYPHVGPTDTSEFVGTYTFTVDSLLTGNTFVYGPTFTDTPFPGFPYVYAADLTVPAASDVTQIMISYFPGSLYNVELYQAHGGALVGTTLLGTKNLNQFVANYGDGSGDFVSMQITDLGPSSVPEPSTITLLGLGALAIGRRIYRRPIA